MCSLLARAVVSKPTRYRWRIRRDNGKHPKRRAVPSGQTGEQKVNDEFANSILPFKGFQYRLALWPFKGHRLPLRKSPGYFVQSSASAGVSAYEPRQRRRYLPSTQADGRSEPAPHRRISALSPQPVHPIDAHARSSIAREGRQPLSDAL